MKKLLALLFLFVVIGIVYSQAPSLMKEKATSSKDTIKKEKTNLLPQTLIQDTMFCIKKTVMLPIMQISFMVVELLVDSALICIK